MTDKITLPMDVSKGIQFDFTVEGITEDDAKKILDVIQEQVWIIGNGAVMAGGFFSVAHMEELEQERKQKEGERIKALIDLYRSDNFCEHGENNYTCPLCNNDDISLDDIEDWENMPDDLLDDYEDLLYGN